LAAGRGPLHPQGNKGKVEKAEPKGGVLLHLVEGKLVRRLIAKNQIVWGKPTDKGGFKSNKKRPGERRTPKGTRGQKKPRTEEGLPQPVTYVR